MPAIRMTPARALGAAFLLATVAACGGGDHGSPASHANAPGAGAAQAASSVPLTGKVIEITMHTDDRGNYFEPSRIDAAAGDVLRFRLVTGVHNVHFLPDSNPGVPNLPPVSIYAQLPGQTIDVALTFGNGDFYFQCDPHALLGMVGRVKVGN